MAKNQLAILDEHGLANVKATKVFPGGFEADGIVFADFCTTNYLGFEFDPLVHERGAAYAREWSALSGWSRLEVDPVLFDALEAKLAALTGAPGVVTAHTITITNFSIVPALAGKGVILTDQKVHTVVYEACRLGRDHGATLERFRHQDMNHLEELLKKHRGAAPVLIAVDGVYSISTAIAPIRELQELARRYDAWLLVDDAHGFGVFGAGPTAENPHGVGGGGVVRMLGGDYERTFYVTSLGKALCTQVAFTTVPAAYREHLPSNHLSYIFSAPVNPYSVGTALACLELNERRGEAARAAIRANLRRFKAGLARLGFTVENHAEHPVVFVEIGALDALIVVAKRLRSQGVLAGLRAFPVVPPDRCGLRFAMTAHQTPAQIDQALAALAG